jgi:hypothetical protein
MASSWDDSDEKTQVFDNERAEGALGGTERWYISPDGKTKEVLTAAEIIERARSGALSYSTLAWRDGLTDWTRLDAVPELMQAVIAFRGSSPATIVREPAGRESAPGISGQRAAVAEPHVHGVPGSSASNRISTSGPLPPPPALPPLPNVPGQPRRVPRSDHDDASTIAMVSAPGKPREPEPTLSSVASQAGQLLAKSSREAFGRASVWASKLTSVVDRDVVIPQVGVVRGRWLALVGFGLALVAVSVLLATRTGGDAAQNGALPTSRAGVTPAEARGEGFDLDDENAGAEANSEKPVLFGQLESLEPVPNRASETGGARIAGGASLKPGNQLKEFDVLAAKSALSAAADKAAACKQGPKGEGSVRVKIATSGKVVSVTLTTAAFQGTAAGDCVQQVFRQATVPAFAGEDKTVFKKFVIH